MSNDDKDKPKSVEVSSFKDIQGLFDLPEVRSLYEKIHAVTAYKMPSASKEIFLGFHRWVTSEPFSYRLQQLREVRVDGERTQYHVFTDGILGNTQNAVAAVHYHKEKIIEIDEAIRALKPEIEKTPLSKLPNMAMGGGNSLKLDFHYQDFIIAVRRCLDYFTLGIDAYFSSGFDNFNKYPAELPKRNPKMVADAILEVFNKHRSQLSHFFSESGRKSVRDVIAHKHFVSAGVINVRHDGIFLAGGGENLDGIPTDAELSKTVLKYAGALEGFVAECLSTLQRVDSRLLSP